MDSMSSPDGLNEDSHSPETTPKQVGSVGSGEGELSGRGGDSKNDSGVGFGRDGLDGDGVNGKVGEGEGEGEGDGDGEGDGEGEGEGAGDGGGVVGGNDEGDCGDREEVHRREMVNLGKEYLREYREQRSSQRKKKTARAMASGENDTSLQSPHDYWHYRHYHAQNIYHSSPPTPITATTINPAYPQHHSPLPSTPTEHFITAQMQQTFSRLDAITRRLEDVEHRVTHTNDDDYPKDRSIRGGYRGSHLRDNIRRDNIRRDNIRRDDIRHEEEEDESRLVEDFEGVFKGWLQAVEEQRVKTKGDIIEAIRETGITSGSNRGENLVFLREENMLLREENRLLREENRILRRGGYDNSGRGSKGRSPSPLETARDSVEKEGDSSVKYAEEKVRDARGDSITSIKTRSSRTATTIAGLFDGGLVTW